MDREQVIERIREKKIITIVRGVYGEDICRLAQALAAGGIGLMEVTFDQSNRNSWKDTAAAIHTIGQSMDGSLIAGAGTVTTPELVEMAYDAGAEYIVSPNVNAEVIRQTRELGMVSLPGAMTPSEIWDAWEAGADFVKVFPVAQLGPAYIRAVRGPLNHIPLLAVGGVDENNVAAFLTAGCEGAGVGGNLVNKEWISQGRWDRITDLARKFAAACHIV